jgi:hypothetical protein
MGFDAEDIDCYCGHQKISRCIHIARNHDKYREKFLVLALAEIKSQTLDVMLYEKTAAMVHGSIAQPNDSFMKIDYGWIQECSQKSAHCLHRLEEELQIYKENFIKESVRVSKSHKDEANRNRNFPV